MDFIVEDGTGLEDATSYIDLDYANDYIGIRTQGTLWEDLDEGTKQNLAMWATQILDQKVRWNGTKYVESSKLRWPRSGVYDRDGLLIPYDVIPVQLMEATAEIMAYLFANAVDGVASTASSAGDLEKIKVAVIELTYKSTVSSSVTAVNPFPPNLGRILYPLGTVPGSGSSNFVKIARV